jgi:branched-subunit amino acid transport protein
MGVLTFLLRLSFLELFGKARVPDGLARALRFVPAAVLPALVAPAFVYREGVLELSLGNEHLLAGLIAALVAWRSKSMLATIIVGMLALWALQRF